MRIEQDIDGEALLGLYDLIHISKILSVGCYCYFLSTGVIRILLLQSMDRGLIQFTLLIIPTPDRIFIKCFVGMNGTLEIVLACKKGAAVTGNLVQSLEMLPIFLKAFPQPSQITKQT
jgi:hypothetical protein